MVIKTGYAMRKTDDAWKRKYRSGDYGLQREEEGR